MKHVLTKLAFEPLLAYVPSMWELAIVLVIVMLLFGSRLPSTMRSLGQSLVQFKKGMREGDDDAGPDKLQ